MAKIEEKKAQVLMETRGYRPIERRELRGKVEIIASCGEEKVLIWCALERVGVRFLREMLSSMRKREIKRGVLIDNHDSRITRAAKALAKDSGVELIPQSFPSFNIFKHELVPKHQIVNREEAEEILNRYHVKVHQLPRISASDPAVIAIGGRPGDIIKIIRKSPVAGGHVYYRYVVEGEAREPHIKGYAKKSRIEEISIMEEIDGM